jgi:hypothetical protein
VFFDAFAFGKLAMTEFGVEEVCEGSFSSLQQRH